MIRVLVVDDHPLYREGVTLALVREADLDVVAEAADADRAVSAAATVRPDIVLLDLSLPGGGPRTVTAILGVSPESRVIVLTVSEDPEDVTASLDAGARGYVLKGVGSGELGSVVRLVASGGSYVAPVLAASIIRNLNPPAGRPADRLTPREAEVIRLVAQGLTNREIAGQLFLAEKTVKHHVTQILHKLNVRNRLEAVLAFYDSDLLGTSGRQAGA